MPSKNRIKNLVHESYYHVYNRGVNKRTIFKDEDDYAVFLNLLKRHLSDKPVFDLKKRQYAHLYGEVELLAFCLMPNHFHLCIYQHNADGLKTLLHAVSASYVVYFNKRHQRIGPLFQDRYKAAMIMTDQYALHISRYIHLNPVDYKSWDFSSLPYYLGKKTASWVRPDRLLEMFEDRENYKKFAADYEENKKQVDNLKDQLANY